MMSISSSYDLDPPLIYDFTQVGPEEEYEDDDDAMPMWDQYVATCFRQLPPIPAISPMRPILSGPEIEAILPHQHVGSHARVILHILGKVKGICKLDLSDNALGPECIKPLLRFVREDENLAMLNISENPLIGPRSMNALLEGMGECQNLEELNISKTGCGKGIGIAIAQMMSGSSSLINLWVNNCRIGASGLEVARAISEHPKLKRFVAAYNELYVGGRRFAHQFGASIGRSSTIKLIDLSNNSLTTEMVIDMLPGLGAATSLRDLNLAGNCIGEFAGQQFATFFAKSQSITTVCLDQNPILNVTINKITGQKKVEADSKKPRGANRGKNDGSKPYTPAVYTIMLALAKAPKMKKCRMMGLVVDTLEWNDKLAALRHARPDIEIEWRGPCQEQFRFKRLPPIHILRQTCQSTSRSRSALNSGVSSGITIPMVPVTRSRLSGAR